MTDERSRKIEEAATKMSDIWDRATMDFNSRDIAKAMGHENYRAMFDAWSALRAACALASLPASGRGYDDGWREGAFCACEEVDRQRCVAEAQGHGEALAYLDDLVSQLRLMGKGEP